MIYDTVFVSDIHLGTDRCNTDKFLEFIKNIQTKKLVFVGDVIDIYCMEKYNTRWNKKHTKSVHEIIKHIKNGTEVIYILGNHDADFRRYCDFQHENFLMCNQYVHIDSKQNKFLCIHGDQHSKFSSGSWKQLFFNKGYELITPLSIWLNRFFRFSLVHYLKNTINGKRYIEQYETDIANYCKSRGDFSGVICGHIHHANIRNFDDITYMCCGDFVDTCSAILEKDGNYTLQKYND
jgi:UDP-2,3-diacylglucosamine pyrophosphatase LpxH